jgi:hypothetical protein
MHGAVEESDEEEGDCIGHAVACGDSGIVKEADHVSHEDGLTDLADRLEDSSEERQTEVEAEAAKEDQVQVRALGRFPCGLGLGLSFLDFAGPFLKESVGDSLDVVVLGELVQIRLDNCLTLAEADG